MLLIPGRNQKVPSNVLTAVKPSSTVESTGVSGERILLSSGSKGNPVTNQVEMGGKHSSLASFFLGLFFDHEDGYSALLE
jgi:hypothetical protein